MITMVRMRVRRMIIPMMRGTRQDDDDDDGDDDENSDDDVFSAADLGVVQADQSIVRQLTMSLTDCHPMVAD